MRFPHPVLICFELSDIQIKFICRFLNLKEMLLNIIFLSYCSVLILHRDLYSSQVWTYMYGESHFWCKFYGGKCICLEMKSLHICYLMISGAGIFLILSFFIYFMLLFYVIFYYSVFFENCMLSGESYMLSQKSLLRIAHIMTSQPPFAQWKKTSNLLEYCK